MNKLVKINLGDTIGLMCPSSHPSSKQDIYKEVKLLEEHGYKVKLGKSMTAKEYYLAGSDELRAKDLMDFYKDPEIKAILCYKGGYGSQRMLPYLDFEEIKKHPKLIMGFSDVTVLLNVLNKYCDFPTVHGEMGVCLSNYDEYTINHFFEVIDHGFISVMKNPTMDLKVINEGICEGEIVGGNLSLIDALMGTPYEIDFDGKILFIEDVNEPQYSIDRMLSSLDLSGKLKNIKGIICGYFTECDDGSEVSIEELLVHYLGKYNVPFVMNFQSGHDKPFINLPIGLKVKLNTYEKSVTALESLYIE